ncbi:hypothetical protein [Natrinema hispanicum]|uniref:hypothetical protein n=1 Tax=Natrinema hispanicum TaxID=392421 RepID=UPI00102D03D8|nr:hypothetical protein [Natrinema hispanicum]
MTTVRCFRCGGGSTETVENGHLCNDCISAVDGGSQAEDELEDATESTGDAETVPTDVTGESAGGGGGNVGLSLDEWLDREQWMCRVGKKPFAPWVSPDVGEAYPDLGTDEDPRWKWKPEYGHWRDGWTAHRAAADSIRVDGVAYLMQPDDPVLFADGDNVVCPETGDRHPAWEAFLAQMAPTFTGPSSSGTGDHAVFYCLEGLPDGAESEPVITLDSEPWGANDDPPKVELYAETKVMALTGEQRPGTPAYLGRLDDGHRNALRCWLEAHDKLGDTTDQPNPTTVSVPDDYEPSATRADETTDEIRDVLTAVNRLTVADLPITIPTANGGDDDFTYHNPPYRSSDSGQSLHLSRDGTTFYDHEGGGSTFGALDWFAYRRGPLTDPRDSLTGAEWWETVDAARNAGAPIPKLEYNPSSEIEHTAVLPNSPTTRAAINGWDWTTADRDDETLTQEDAWDRTADAITGANERCDDVLIEALPTMGKSYSAVKSIAETTKPTTIATGRGRKEQYARYRDWADEHSLEHYTLPAFTHDCPTANGEHGEDSADTVARWYNAGATPQQIHKFAESKLGHPLPCQHDGECPYSSKWRFEPDDYDVLIGHYSHLYNEKVTTGRSVLIDEFPGSAYETTLEGEQLSRAVSTFLEDENTIPFDDYTDLIENREDDARRGEALLWFEDYGVETDGLQAFVDGGHALAPVAVYTLLASEKLGNGWERARIGDALGGQLGLFNRAESRIHVMDPPSIDYARNVVGLDGTPTPEMWRIALGRRRFNHRPVLQDEERAEYIRDALGLRIVRTTESVKSYSAGEDEIANRVTVDEDAALLEAIDDTHGQLPDLITTARAEKLYDDEGVLEEHVSRTKHYGNVLGSNEFATERLGAVIGSRNFGPDYVKKWGAYLDEAIEPQFPGEDLPLEAGVRTDYGEVGNRIRKHMTEHETLQATMRFGRDGNGAVVYVHTNTLPDWVPTAGEGRVLKTWSDGMRQVIEAARDLDKWTTAELAAHPAVEIGERQVRTHLWRLVDREVLSRRTEGNGYVWQDDGLHRVNDHGEVELDPIEDDDLNGDESAEVARITHYRWDFWTSGDTHRLRQPTEDAEWSPASDSQSTADGPPPNRGD